MPLKLQAPYRPEQRGYHISYRGNGQACPGCGRSHWHIGRTSAECAFCMTALPIENAVPSGSSLIVHKNMFARNELRESLAA
jgi:hypothetical protein